VPSREILRVARLIDIREGERKREVLELVRLQGVELLLETEEQQALRELLSAEAKRREFALAPVAVADYLAQDDWQETLAQRHVFAKRKLFQARAATKRAQGRVNVAQVRLRQMEQLRERILRTELEKTQRVERRSEDEIAQRAVFQRSREGAHEEF
jgi:flagellar biosynthesis chaperone FliJ